MSLRFSIPMKPIAKGRPRFGRTWRGKPTAYTPETTAVFEAHFKAAALRFRPVSPLVGALRLRAAFTFRAPTKKLIGKPKETRADLDNLLKAVTDAMNGTFYKDDGQISEIYAVKVYGASEQIDIELERIAV